MLKEFEQARDEHMRILTGKVEGKKSSFIGMDRRQSYVNLETLITEECQSDGELVEEDTRNTVSKSTDLKNF